MTEQRKKQALEANHYAHSALQAIEWADENQVITAKLVDKVLEHPAYEKYIEKKLTQILVDDDKRRSRLMKRLYSAVTKKEEQNSNV